MAHLFQVGAGSGGMPVLDLVARDERVTAVTLVEPDVFKPHNVARHLFPASAVGRPKAELAAEWLRERRPGLAVEVIAADLLDPARQGQFRGLAAACDLGVCAADNEPAKYHFDALLRPAGKPWTLGEVLSGGIGGWVHRFEPGGPCYGCVASSLKRSVSDAPPAPAPDYAAPGGPIAEATVPAGKAAISAIASLHALLTLNLLDGPSAAPGFTSLLLALSRVPEVFEEAFRPYRFRISRAADCLICGPAAAGAAGAGPAAEDLDVALDQALARLGGDA
jgi:molybdopterin/thiamine biosynthesis adenylyltransferase